MGIAPDAGGGRVSLGKPFEPDYFELETTAQTAVMKEGLGLVPNTLDVSFAQLGGNIWKYQSSSSKPLLPFFVFSEVHHADNPTMSPLEEQQLKEVYEKLPIKIREKLKQDQEKNPEDRDPFWVAVDQVLSFSAKIFTWMTTVSEINPGLFLENNYKNQMYLDRALAHWIYVAEEYLWMMAESDPQIGRGMLATREILDNLIKCAVEAQTKKKSAVGTLLKQVLEFQNLFDQEKVPHSPGVLHSLIQCLIPIAYGFVNPTAQLLTATLMTTQRDFLKKNNLDEVFEKIGFAFTDQMELAKGVEAFTKLISLVFTAIVIEGTGLKNSALSPVILDKLDTAGAWAYQLSSGFVTATQGLNFLTDAVIKHCFPEGEKFSTSTLTALCEQLLILAALRENPHLKGVSPLLRGMRDALIEQLNLVKEDPELSRELQAIFLQGFLALKKGSANTYFQAFDQLLGSIDIKRLNLLPETDECLSSLVILLMASHRMGRQTQVTTMISQSA